ncbi:MAG: hypothetical protein AB1500_12650 [Bacillota bacterium]
MLLQFPPVAQLPGAGILKKLRILEAAQYWEASDVVTSNPLLLPPCGIALWQTAQT